MAKYYGQIGFFTEEESPPDSGIWRQMIVERNYRGDVLQNIRHDVVNTKINDDYTVNNRISIVADPYALNALYAMRYITWLGQKWKISSVDVQMPRLVLTLGGLYHGEQNGITEIA